MCTKEHLTTVPTLAYFSLNKPTRLCTNASQHGLGFVLQQQQLETKQWLLVQAGSRFLTPAESRYAVIELELLAVAWAIMKCKLFLRGLQNFQIHSNVVQGEQQYSPRRTVSTSHT